MGVSTILATVFDGAPEIVDVFEFKRNRASRHLGTVLTVRGKERDIRWFYRESPTKLARGLAGVCSSRLAASRQAPAALDSFLKPRARGSPNISDRARNAINYRGASHELSCAAVVRNIGHAAVLTDNRRDFSAITSLVDGRLQKTPQLLGWLYVEGHLTDPDIGEVIREHKASGGQMAKVYQQAHLMACERRLMMQFPETTREVESGDGHE